MAAGVGLGRFPNSDVGLYSGSFSAQLETDQWGRVIRQNPRQIGFCGATASYLENPNTLKTVVTIMEVIDTVSSHSIVGNGVKGAIGGAAAIVAICTAGKACLGIFRNLGTLCTKSRSWKVVRELGENTLKCLAKTAEFVLAMVKAGAFKLADVARWRFGVLKSGAASIVDIVELVKAEQAADKLQAHKHVMNPTLLKALKRTNTAERVKAFVGFALHFTVLLGVVLTVMINPLVMLALGSAYIITCIAWHYIKVHGEDKAQKVLDNRYEIALRAVPLSERAPQPALNRRVG